MKHSLSIVMTLLAGLALAVTPACGKDKKKEAAAEPAKAEPAKADPAKAEPAKADPAKKKDEPAAGGW